MNMDMPASPDGGIARLLAMQSRARALHQYMSLLAGEAELVHIALAAADSPLVQ